MIETWLLAPWHDKSLICSPLTASVTPPLQLTTSRQIGPGNPAAAARGPQGFPFNQRSLDGADR